jgi:hypothetical protein
MVIMLQQLFTVELTQRQQLLLALDIWAQGVRQLASLLRVRVYFGAL